MKVSDVSQFTYTQNKTHEYQKDIMKEQKVPGRYLERSKLEDKCREKYNEKKPKDGKPRKDEAVKDNFEISVGCY